MDHQKIKCRRRKGGTRMNDENHGKMLADKLLKVRLLHMRLQTIIQGAILLVLVGAVVFLGGQFSTLRRCMNLIDADLQALDMNEVNTAVDALSDAADRFSEIDVNSLNATVSSLHEAADKLGNVDIPAMNDAVDALKGAAGKLENVDVDSLNSLVGSLEEVASKLQNAVNAVSGVFSR